MPLLLSVFRFCFWNTVAAVVCAHRGVYMNMWYVCVYINMWWVDVVCRRSNVLYDIQLSCDIQISCTHTPVKDADDFHHIAFWILVVGNQHTSSRKIDDIHHSAFWLFGITVCLECLPVGTCVKRIGTSGTAAFGHFCCLGGGETVTKWQYDCLFFLCLH